MSDHFESLCIKGLKLHDSHIYLDPNKSHSTTPFKNISQLPKLKLNFKRSP